MRSVHGWIAVMLVVLLPGCAATRQVRYVYQDRDFGVIGMPENSDRWPTRYRHQAEQMMQAHFPDGHEIVRAEEVVEGTRTLTVQGTSTAEVLPSLPTSVLQVGRLGRSSCRSQADKLALKECRIIYRRAGRATGPDVYAPLATLTPTRYVDPNDLKQHSARAIDEPAGEKSSADSKPEPPLHAAQPKTTDSTEPLGEMPNPKRMRTTNQRAVSSQDFDKALP